MTDSGVPCWIYRSPRKDEMYLYIAREDDFSCVPEALLVKFGEPEPVMEILLNTQRSLAREDINLVLANLRTQGFHLQMPPKMSVELYRGD
ncbi:MAG: YcgL domain-containing protein [Candidatus Thiodiazotropha sp.]